MCRILIYLSFVTLAGCNLTDVSFPASNHTKVVTAKAFKKATGIDGPLKTDSSLLQQKIKSVYKKAKAENYNIRYALLADLGLHSGSKRLYVIDLTNKTIIASGLVAHGSSANYLPNGVRQYSNANGSLCSSLGMYRIGGSYQGRFGLAYKLYGLSRDNSNAYARAIVLHSLSCVPNTESASPICQSWGCPMVSPAFLKILGKYIENTDKPMLLYLFDSTL